MAIPNLSARNANNNAKPSNGNGKWREDDDDTFLAVLLLSTLSSVDDALDFGAVSTVSTGTACTL